MPPNKQKVQGPDGKMHDAESVGFQTGGEYWNEYLLDDGTLIRMKPVVADFLKLDGFFDQEGNPLYVVKAQNVIVVNAPEDKRKRPQS